jgi:uncharacterized phage protein (TIGR02218 family)
MSYLAAEVSDHDASPVECYKFIGSFRTYRYTSADVQQTVNFEDYEPVAGRRGNIRAGTQSDDNLSLEIELPFDVDVVQDYAYSESPPGLVLEVYRVHRGTDFSTDWSLLWKGKVSAFNINGRVAKIRVPSIFSRALQTDVPSAYYQGPCNHVLFDQRCGLARSLFTTTTTVTGVGTTAIQVASTAEPDGSLAAGEVVITRTGERRLILANSAGLLTINYPFVDARNGDEVEITQGCDHSFSTCKTKFNNSAQYGGHPFIPADNPFQGEVS